MDRTTHDKIDMALFSQSIPSILHQAVNLLIDVVEFLKFINNQIVFQSCTQIH